MEHHDFVKLWNAGCLRVEVDKALAQRFAGIETGQTYDARAPRKSKLHWLLAIPPTLCVMYFAKWWVGLLVLGMVALARSRAAGSSAFRHLSDLAIRQALDDEHFFNSAVANNLLSIRDERTGAGVPTEMTSATAQRIVQDYGVALASGPEPGCVADVRRLPHPKERIKQALLLAIRSSDQAQMREHLKAAYILLSGWQIGVGEENVGVSFAGIDVNSDVDKLAKHITSQRRLTDKWMKVIEQDERALKHELQRHGIW